MAKQETTTALGDKEHKSITRSAGGAKTKLSQTESMLRR